MLFALKKALGTLLLPPASSLALALLGWLMWRRGSHRVGPTLVWAGVGSLFVLSLPAVAGLLTWLVYDGSRFDPARATSAEAIVVLGGGLRVAPEYGGDTLGRLSLERIRYGARLARETALPVLVTGGRLFTRRTEGEVMREALEGEFHVRVRWVEACAHNTHENAQLSAALLKQSGVSHVVLVTHGVDARRARREFVAAGLAVTSAPTDLASVGIDSAYDLIPSASALQASTLAVYEILGNIALALRLNRSGRAPPAECQPATAAHTGTR
jgi:uncharacterized SAM-binding protein YcdF (DUF218 family)